MVRLQVEFELFREVDDLFVRIGRGRVFARHRIMTKRAGSRNGKVISTVENDKFRPHPLTIRPILLL